MLIDVHFHPTDEAMDDDLGRVMARARARGVHGALAAYLVVRTILEGPL